MTQPAQVDELSAKHDALDRMIQEEIQRPGTSDLRLAELKRRKLRLKDEIEELKAKTRH